MDGVTDVIDDLINDLMKEKIEITPDSVVLINFEYFVETQCYILSLEITESLDSKKKASLNEIM